MTHNHNNRNYYNIALGKPGFRLNFAVNTVENWLRCEIYIYTKNPQSDFSRLKNAQSQIEKGIETSLTWEGKVPNGEGYRIALYNHNQDIRQSNNNPKFKWFEDYGPKFFQTFKPII